MKKISLLATSVYSVILLSILLVAGFEFEVPKAILSALLPVWLYFFLRVVTSIPFFNVIFARRRYTLAMLICGVYAAIFTLLAVVANLVNVRSLTQVAYVLVLVPLLAHFLLLIPKKKFALGSLLKAKLKKEVSEVSTIAEVVGPSESEAVKEEQRRKFIKLIAGAGVGIFAASVLNPKKASAAFFGSVPGPGVISVKDSGGTKIDPAIKSPTDGYAIANIDSASYPAYYGFVNKDGGWYIMRENPQNTFQYSSGGSSFSTNWTGRAGLSYASFDTTF